MHLANPLIYDTTYKKYSDAKEWLKRLKQDVDKLNEFTEQKWRNIYITELLYDFDNKDVKVSPGSKGPIG